MRHHGYRTAASAVLAVLVAALWPPGSSRALEYKAVETLLDTETTIIGQPFAYPAESPAKVKAVIVTLLPGEETGWHEHHVPLLGHMLEGELTVDYGEKGKRTYRPGDTLMEAVDYPHNGVNTGETPMRVLVVFMSSDTGVETEPVPAPGD